MKINNKKLNRNYVAGFVDGEGCFGLQFRKDVRHERLGSPAYYSRKAQFIIVARADEKELFERIKDLFKCGENYETNGEIHYSVQKLYDLHDAIIPFFRKYNLEGKKKYDFELWAEAVEIIYKNKRNTTNIQKGVRGFTKTVWDEQDFNRLLEIHKLMQKYKSKRPQGFKHISIAQELTKDSDKE